MIWESKKTIKHYMGSVLEKVVDSVLLGFFLAAAMAVPLIHSQACVSEELFPRALVELKVWYAREYGDHVIVEKPRFYVGLVWLELLFHWPLSLLNLYAIVVSSKPSWFRTTCLVYGVSVLTCLVAILSELIGSGRASDKLLYHRCPFLGLAILAMLRCLLLQFNNSTNSKKKKA